jgi:hypothetical protein
MTIKGVEESEHNLIEGNIPEFLDGPRKSKKKLSHDGWCAGQDSNKGPEYKAVAWDSLFDGWTMRLMGDLINRWIDGWEEERIIDGLVDGSERGVCVWKDMV